MRKRKLRALLAHVNDNAKEQREEIQKLRRELVRVHTQNEERGQALEAADDRAVAIRKAFGSHPSTPHEDFLEFIRLGEESRERWRQKAKDDATAAATDLETLRTQLRYVNNDCRVLADIANGALVQARTAVLTSELAKRLPMLFPSDPARVALLRETFAELDRVCAAAAAGRPVGADPVVADRSGSWEPAEGTTEEPAVYSADGYAALRLEDTGNSNHWDREVVLVIERRELVQAGPERGAEVTTWTRFKMDGPRVHRVMGLFQAWRADVHRAAVAFRSPEAAS